MLLNRSSRFNEILYDYRINNYVAKEDGSLCLVGNTDTGKHRFIVTTSKRQLFLPIMAYNNLKLVISIFETFTEFVVCGVSSKTCQSNIR